MNPARLVPFLATALMAGCTGSQTATSPAAAGTATTLAASAIGGTTATLNGSVSLSGEATGASFEYGTTTNYGSTTPIQALGSGTASVAVTANVTGLAVSTTYHYRLVATTLAATTAGSDVTFTTTATTPVGSEFFSGVLAPQGSSFYAFTVSQAGPVNLTLVSLTLNPIVTLPDTVIGIGFGTPAGEGCSMSSSVNTTVGLVSQLNVSSGAGIFCANVYDVGNLTAPATFVLRIAHS